MRKSSIWQGIGFSLLFTSVFLSHFLTHLNVPLGPAHNDVYLITFIIKHYVTIFSHHDFAHILTLPMFYGIPNSLFLSEHYFLFGVVGYLLHVLTPDYIFLFNALAFLAVAANFFSMYVFVSYLTGKVWPSLLASVIFAFNPFVMSHFPDIIIYYALGFIPLIFLAIERSLKKPTNSNTFSVFVLLMAQLATSMTYVVYLSVLLPLYVGVRIWQRKIPLSTLLNRGTILGLILFIGISLVIAIPYARFFSKTPTGRSVEENEFFSAWPTDYLFGPTKSLMYGRVRSIAYTIAPAYVFMSDEIAEHNLFWGVVPTLLILLSLLWFRQIKKYALWTASFAFLVYSTVLSYGPKIHLSNTISVPGLYGLFYSIYPLFQYLRVAARFAMFTYLFLGIIVAYTTVYLTRRLNKIITLLIGIALIGIVLLEYWNKPLDYTSIPKETRIFYAFINQQKNIHVIAEFPMGNLSGGISTARNQYVDAQYLFWATTLHDKTLFNGYSGVIPLLYQRRQRYVSSNFPTTPKIEQLISWGVDSIVLHKDEFVYADDYDTVREKLKEIGLTEAFSTQNLVLFTLHAGL